MVLDNTDIVYMAVLYKILYKPKSLVKLADKLKKTISRQYDNYVQRQNNDNNLPFPVKMQSIGEFGQEYITNIIERLQKKIDNKIDLSIEAKREMWYLKVKYKEAKKNKNKFNPNKEKLGPEPSVFPTVDFGSGYNLNIDNFFPGEGGGYFEDDKYEYDEDDYLDDNYNEEDYNKFN